MEGADRMSGVQIFLESVDGNPSVHRVWIPYALPIDSMEKAKNRNSQFYSGNAQNVF